MISVIIPNFNGAEHLKTCLASLQRQSFKDFKLIIADNNSSDGSLAVTKTIFPGAEIIQIDYNSGFAHAVNEGIKREKEKFSNPFILLLNNDTELTDNFLQSGADAFKNEGADIIAVKMLNFRLRNIIDDTGNFLTRKGGSPYSRGRGETDKGQYDKKEYIFSACAGAAFYKKEVFEAIGMFDERFFAYFEDIDLGFRAQLAGFKCLYVPEIVCYHKRGGTTDVATMAFQIKYNERNLVLLRFKNYPKTMYIKNLPRFVLSLYYRQFKLLRDHGVKVFFASIAGYFEGSFMLLSYFQERKRIQALKTVSNEYLESLFR